MLNRLELRPAHTRFIRFSCGGGQRAVARGAQRPVARSLLHRGCMSTPDLFMRRFAGVTFDPKEGKEAIWGRWKSKLETDFFGGGN